MEEEIIYDPTIDGYRVQGIHVTDDGESLAVHNGRVVGKNAFIALPEASVTGYSKSTRDKLKILGIDVQNKDDLKRLQQNHLDKDGNINWQSFQSSPWKASQLQSLKDKNWRQTYEMKATPETFNAVTGGFFNQIVPTQLIRNIYNISTQNPNWRKQFIFGNNGIVSDKFASKHPYASIGINGAVDLFSGLRFKSPISIRKSVTTKSIQFPREGSKKLYIPETREIFQHNAILESKFYDKPVQNLIKDFLKHRDINKLSQSALPKEQQEQLNNFIKTYKFSGIRVPYYTDSSTLLKDHPLLNTPEVRSQLQFIDNALIDSGDDFAVIAKDPNQRLHEAEHVLQRRRYFSETGSPYMKKQEKLLNEAYPHQKGGIPEASEIIEKGAVNQQLRSLIIQKFKNDKGRFPSTVELQDYIDSLNDKQIFNLLKRNTNAYGYEYSKNNSINMKKVKEALKYIGAISIASNEKR